MTAWWLIVSLAVWTYALRIAGPMMLRRVEVPETASRILNNIAPAVLSALVVTGMFTSGRSLVVDERALGFVAAGAAVVAKLPPLAVIVVAAGTTAAARALL
jgi:branched-subunit amino acid transport protein